MIPEKIKPFFDVTLLKMDFANKLIEGGLACCGEHAFDVLTVGEVKHGMFFDTCLFPEKDTIILKAICKKCGKVILVFDSRCDGYGHLKEKQHAPIAAKPFRCKKCSDDSFSVSIKYEYPTAKELKELGISETDNAFTWIWVTLGCNKCGAGYKNFIDLETE